MTSPKKLTLDGYTQVTKGKVKKGDILKWPHNTDWAEGLIGCEVIGQSWQTWRKIPKPKTKNPPPLPSGLTPPPNDYVFLGRVKDIVVPKSWATSDGYKDKMGFAWYDCDWKKGWETDDFGWMNAGTKYYMAAKINSTLYTMQGYSKPAPLKTFQEVKHWNPLYPKVRAPKGYRFVKEGEIVKPDDKHTFDQGKEWDFVNSAAGKPHDCGQVPMIRAIVPNNKAPDLVSELEAANAENARLTKELSFKEADCISLRSLYEERNTQLKDVTKELAEIRRQLTRVEEARDNYNRMHCEVAEKLAVAKRKFRDFQEMF